MRWLQIRICIAPIPISPYGHSRAVTSLTPPSRHGLSWRLARPALGGESRISAVFPAYYFCCVCFGHINFGFVSYIFLELLQVEEPRNNNLSITAGLSLRGHAVRWSSYLCTAPSWGMVGFRLAFPRVLLATGFGPRESSTRWRKIAPITKRSTAPVMSIHCHDRAPGLMRAVTGQRAHRQLCCWKFIFEFITIGATRREWARYRNTFEERNLRGRRTYCE